MGGSNKKAFMKGEIIMKKIFTKTITIVTMLAIVLAMAMPMQAQAASRAKPKLNKTKATLTITDKKKAPSFTLKVKNVSKKAVKKAVWKSSNKKVATVSKSGKVVARKKGKATITVKVSGKKLTCKVTVADNRKPKKPTPTETQACDHDWEKHWTVFEEEGDCPEGTFMGFCYCGLFTDEEKYHQHLWILQTQAALCTSKERMCGLHGSEVKSECDSYSNPDGSEHYKLRTEYIDYMYCTKCGKRVTNRF